MSKERGRCILRHVVFDRERCAFYEHRSGSFALTLVIAFETLYPWPIVVGYDVAVELTLPKIATGTCRRSWPGASCSQEYGAPQLYLQITGVNLMRCVALELARPYSTVTGGLRNPDLRRRGFAIERSKLYGSMTRVDTYQSERSP